MRLTRVHVDGPLTSEAHQFIRGTAANHIARVLRLRVGDNLTLFDGRGGEYDARINEFGKDVVHVTVNEHRAVERESPLSITLAQGISRGERMDLVIQKATELGVTRIVPVLTERCVVRLDSKQAESKLRHWRGIVVAACEQCGRNHLPAVAEPLHLHAFLRELSTVTNARPDTSSSASAEVLEPLMRGTLDSEAAYTAQAAATSGPSDYRLLLSPTGNTRIRDLAATGALVTVLIGPEGGLSEAEHESALAAGFTPVQLGPRILRTETAALAALTAIQQQLGDL